MQKHANSKPMAKVGHYYVQDVPQFGRGFVVGENKLRHRADFTSLPKIQGETERSEVG